MNRRIFAGLVLATCVALALVALRERRTIDQQNAALKGLTAQVENLQRATAALQKQVAELGAQQPPTFINSFQPKPAPALIVPASPPATPPPSAWPSAIPTPLNTQPVTSASPIPLAKPGMANVVPLPLGTPDLASIIPIPLSRSGEPVLNFDPESPTGLFPGNNAARIVNSGNGGAIIIWETFTPGGN